VGERRIPIASEPLSILVVDDEPAVARALARLLQSDGHRVDLAVSGQEALEKLDANSYDLVLTDVRMPEMDGRTLYDRISRTAQQPAPVIIFVTAAAGDPEIQLFLTNTGCLVLTKPYSKQELWTVIQKARARP
jgi:CheY-like chemotaxis protein